MYTIIILLFSQYLPYIDGSSKNNKFIDLLSVSEKKELISNVARRFAGNVKLADESSIEITEKQLNEHEKLVNNIIEQESAQLRMRKSLNMADLKQNNNNGKTQYVDSSQKNGKDTPSPTEKKSVLINPKRSIKRVKRYSGSDSENQDIQVKRNSRAFIEIGTKMHALDSQVIQKSNEKITVKNLQETPGNHNSSHENESKSKETEAAGHTIHATPKIYDGVPTNDMSTTGLNKEVDSVSETIAKSNGTFESVIETTPVLKETIKYNENGTPSNLNSNLRTQYSIDVNAKPITFNNDSKKIVLKSVNNDEIHSEDKVMNNSTQVSQNRNVTDIKRDSKIFNINTNERPIPAFDKTSNIHKSLKDTEITRVTIEQPSKKIYEVNETQGNEKVNNTNTVEIEATTVGLPVLTTANTNIENSDYSKILRVGGYNKNKLDPRGLDVFPLASNNQTFVSVNKISRIGDGKPDKEQPYYAPIYNYDPSNAYFNALNRYGPNPEDMNEKIVKDTDKSSNKIHFNYDPRSLRLFTTHNNILHNGEFHPSMVKNNNDKKNKKETQTFFFKLPVAVGPPKFETVLNEYHDNIDYYADKSDGYNKLRNSYVEHDSSDSLERERSSTILKPGLAKKHLNAVRNILYLGKLDNRFNAYMKDNDVKIKTDISSMTLNKKILKKNNGEPTKVNKKSDNSAISLDYYFSTGPDRADISLDYYFGIDYDSNLRNIPQVSNSGEKSEKTKYNRNNENYSLGNNELLHYLGEKATKYRTYDLTHKRSNDIKKDFNSQKKSISIDYFFGSSPRKDYIDSEEGTMPSDNTLDSYYEYKTKPRKNTETNNILRSGLNDVYDSIEIPKHAKLQISTLTGANRYEYASSDIEATLNGIHEEIELMPLQKINTKFVTERQIKPDFSAFVEVLRDMIDSDDSGLQRYNWLGTAVDVQTALEKLSRLAEELHSGLRVHPSDHLLYKYVHQIHQIAKIQEEKLNVEERAPSLLNKVQSSVERKKVTQSSGGEKDADLDDFFDDIRYNLDDLHNTIKHVSLASSYKSTPQQWYQDIKVLRLNDASEKELLQLILHLATTRFVGLLEESARYGLERDYVRYVREHGRHVQRTIDELVFIRQLLNKITLLHR